jgi:broad specificity phosphatase PhoE
MFLVRHGQSEFNVHYNLTGRDPGIRDPGLTEIGVAQARVAAERLAGQDVRQIVASPYRRAIQTGEIIAQALKLDLVIEPLVGERSVFSCDIGTPATDLSQIWPKYRFDHLPDSWWPEQEESDAALQRRCACFRQATDERPDRDHLIVISHWGFILGLTGLPVGNCSIVRFRIAPRPSAEVVHHG